MGVAHLQDFTINTILTAQWLGLHFLQWVLVQELVHFVTIVQSLLRMQSLKLGIPYFFDQTPRLLFISLLVLYSYYLRADTI